MRQIAENAGLDGAVVETVQDAEGRRGLNADTTKYEDLTKTGIIDPAKVTRSALQNAASIAKYILTTERHYRRQARRGRRRNGRRYAGRRNARDDVIR